MDVQNFYDAMSSIASTVFVVTTAGEGGQSGVTVTSLCSVTSEQPTLLACVHHLSPAANAIMRNGVFCVNVLDEKAAKISDAFAGRSLSEDGDKFAGLNWRLSPSGCPMLEEAISVFDCKLAQDTLWATHHVIFGHVTDVFMSEGKPLIYTRRAYQTLAVA